MNTPGGDPTSARDRVFSQVFDEHWAAVRHHIEGAVDDDAVTTEILSEVFLAAWSRLVPRRPMGRVWLFRRADREIRARVPHATTRTGTLVAVQEGIVGASGEKDHAAVLRALSVLHPRERRIIVLTYWDGLPVGDIAELSRTSVNRVRKTLHRAQDHLRRALRSEGVIVDD